MKYLRVGAAAVNQTPMDWKGNARRIREACEDAQKNSVEMLCLPELCITGYGCEDMFLSSHTHHKAVETLASLRDVGGFGMVTMVGLPIVYGNAIYNCMAVIQNGRIEGIVPKQNLAQDGIHYEPRWFKPWPSGTTGKVYLKGIGKVPIGDLIFETPTGIRFGFEICEDAWVADRPGSKLAHRGVDVIFSPSASHFAFGKQKVRRRFVTEGSRAFSSAYVYSNLLGNESGRVIFDGATLIASGGEIVSEGQRFSFREHSLTCGDVDIDQLHLQRYSREGFRPEDAIGGVKVEIGGVDTTEVPKPLRTVTYDTTDLTKEEEFSRAVALGMFDYLKKSRIRGYVVSLSGGADSTAAAVLVYLMEKYAEREYTREEISHFLPQFGADRVLTCVYQATQNSSETTREAAEEVAKAVGAHYIELDVDPLVEGYKDVVGKALNTEWDWEKHDVALQNIQARTRSPSAWMIANVQRKILLATSNRSEAAVGYATMDGDTSGGLSPLGGIDKAFLLQWLEHMEEEIPALSYVNKQQPTAELKPEEYGQTDEGDLMPYDVLDAIERAAIRDKKSPLEVLKWVDHKFTYERALLVEWVDRFFTLWCRNQWKRERYAPSFHLDDENLDPKTWCRFPILSSGYEEELEALRKLKDT
jgi:NAD+ synthase (glutamine-hydrolysing)